MQPVEIDDADLAELEERLDLQALEAWLADTIAALPGDQRAAILARVVDERDYAEIAVEVRTSPSVIRKRVSRGLATLRSQAPEER